MKIRLTAFVASALLAGPLCARGAGLPVSASHPRLLLTGSQKAFLQGKVAAADPAWVRLRQQADLLAGFSVNPYNYSRRTDEPDNTIFHDHQGDGCR